MSRLARRKSRRACKTFLATIVLSQASRSPSLAPRNWSQRLVSLDHRLLDDVRCIEFASQSRIELESCQHPQIPAVSSQDSIDLGHLVGHQTRLWFVFGNALDASSPQYSGCMLDVNHFLRFPLVSIP